MVESEDIRFSVIDHKKAVEFNIIQDKRKKNENFTRPFLKKGSGLTRFYKDKKPEQVQNQLKAQVSKRKKPLPSEKLCADLNPQNNNHSETNNHKPNGIGNFRNHQQQEATAYNLQSKKEIQLQQKLPRYLLQHNICTTTTTPKSKSRLSTSPINPHHDNNNINLEPNKSNSLIGDSDNEGYNDQQEDKYNDEQRHSKENSDDDDELKIFEALEEAAGAGISFCSTSSIATRFLKTKLNAVKNKETILIEKLESVEKQLVNSPARSKENLHSLNQHYDRNINKIPHHDTSGMLCYSPTSSLFDSEDEIQVHDDDNDEITVDQSVNVTDDEDEQEKEQKNIILVGEQIEKSQMLHKYYRSKKNHQQLNDNSVRNNTLHNSNTLVDTKSIVSSSCTTDALEKENIHLKARVLYLEEKMEKNTIEWWSYKEQMIEIVHGIQSSINRKDIQLDTVQKAFTQKLQNFQDEFQTKSQKWYENHINMVEKVKRLEQELEISQEQLENVKLKMQETIKGLENKLIERNIQCDKNHQCLLQRIRTLENSTILINNKDGNSTPNTVSNEKASRLSSINFETKGPNKPSINTEQSTKVLNTKLEEENLFHEEFEDGDLGMTKTLKNGDKETLYSNGTRKIVAHDFSEMKYLYTNGDIRTVKRDGTVKYFYGESGTWHTTYTNGVEFYEFANGQTERRNPNGVVEVIFANGCVKYTHPSGTEECIFADNTILRVQSNGEKAVVLPNGQQEILGRDYKKRIYPDGTAKVVYNDGSQETRYSNGRIRIKSAEGVIVADI